MIRSSASDESLEGNKTQANGKARPRRQRTPRWVMLDESDKVDVDSVLFQMLCHYAKLADGNRESWQDRVMEWDGVSARDLSRLHGELIALGWIEQNTGMTPVVKPGIAAACYRVTTHGLRAYRNALA